jgi:peptidoglycan hydrolase-like protein with peptidoglycan-binding domain
MYPKTNLQPGQSGPEVAKLQQFLLQQGLLTQADISTGPGIYGPKTTAAVKKWQQQNGVDNTSGPGYWGPRSIAAASGSSGPETQESVDRQYMEAAAKNPKVQALVNNGDSVESIFYALQKGDLSGITDSQGLPFSPEDQQKAMEQAMEDNRLYYEALQKKETADTEASLAQKQADYQQYLINSGQQFEQDKTKSDETSADRGVLFSGSRAQKQKNLERAYQQDQEYNRNNLSRDIASTARDFQYKYGDKASRGLKDYYQLGGNTFNANVARGGVGTTGLSKVYNPNDFNFQGTRNTERTAAANQRAAGSLWNRGNKLLASGYNNQY